jgi:hypothetical protein
VEPWKIKSLAHPRRNSSLARECHGFINPHGLRSRVVRGAGMGWQIATLEKPTPVAWV